MALRSALVMLVASCPAWCFDSALIYSTYLRAGFTPAAVTADAAGNVYVVGSIIVNPTTRQQAALVVKLNPAGTQSIFARILGGSIEDTGAAIVVDSGGDAFVTGTTYSPDFPVTPGRQLGTAPVLDAQGGGASRTFLAKLDPQGAIVFSEFLGGSSFNQGQAVALTAEGNIVVSGMASGGFPVTPGAYNAGGTPSRPYLTELDPTGALVQFSAFGIGGSALAMDAAGNIYVAGSTLLSDYPTTPGVYQPVFPRVMICYGLCQLTLPGTNQYVTKVDPTGTKLLYSTAVPGAGQTFNAGLAVDTLGNAYLTGLAYADYSYTAPAPKSPQVRPFLTKLDPLAQHALYSVDAGGAGVALDGNGHVFTGGSYNNANLSGGLPIPSELLPAPPPGSSPVPVQCQENDVTTASQAYVSEIDAASGNVLSTVLVDASNLAATSIALAGSSVWLTGGAQQADVPITPGALAPFPLTAGPLPGAYLGAADFSQPPAASAPVVACVLDAANTARTSPVAPNQLLALMGSNLGPEQGVSGSDNATKSLGGVSVTFDGDPAAILYASASQINVAVPLSVAGQNSTVMQVSVNGVPGQARVLPVVSMTPSLFANLTTVFQNCANIGTFDPAVFVPVAQYAGGSANSCQHPAKPGTVVSFFLNGLGLQGNASSFGPFSGLDIPVVARIGAWSAEVVGVTPASPFVWRVDVAVPPLPPGTGLVQFNVAFSIESETAAIPVGPIGVGAGGRPPGSPVDTLIWVSP